jgi:acetoin utilization protein AcuB
MFVADFMSKQLVTVLDTDDLQRADALLADHRIHQLPVVDASGRLVGIITDRDIRSAIGYDRALAERLTVQEVMTADPDTVPLDAPLEEALGMLCAHRYGALPVLCGNRLVGVLSRHDLLCALQQILGVDRTGARIEVALPHQHDDLADIFKALRDHNSALISAVIAHFRQDGPDAVLYLRVEREARRPIERVLRQAGMILLEPERPTGART